MATNKSDDSWLEVLAGKGGPTDHETRQSAALRGFFELQEKNTPKLDEATQRRIMNALEAKGIFAQAAPSKPVKPASLLTKVMAWLFPEGHVSGGRLSAVAVAVMAITMLPFLLHGPVGDDDLNSIKSLPSLAEASWGLPTSVIESNTPEQLSVQLVAILARHGVVAELRSANGNQWVRAQIPAERLSAVQSDLVSMGLSTKPDGQLVVQFRRQP